MPAARLAGAADPFNQLRTNMGPKVGAIAAGLLVLVLGVVALVAPTFSRPAFAGTVFEPPLPAQEFTLTDHSGHSFRLSDVLGKVVLIYFGYTHCPDECPLTMAKLVVAFDLLNENGADIQVLLVTTDPARDTPQELRAYLARFHQSFRGLTGSPEQLGLVYGDYGVTVLDGGETHANRVYVIDRAGNLRLTFPYEMTASAIASDLKMLVREP